MPEYYIVVTEFDGTEAMAAQFGLERQGPLAHETYLNLAGNLEAARLRAHNLGNNMGPVRIAKLQFID